MNVYITFKSTNFETKTLLLVYSNFLYLLYSFEALTVIIIRCTINTILTWFFLFLTLLYVICQSKIPRTTIIRNRRRDETERYRFSGVKKPDHNFFLRPIKYFFGSYTVIRSPVPEILEYLREATNYWF